MTHNELIITPISDFATVFFIVKNHVLEAGSPTMTAQNLHMKLTLFPID